MADETNGGRVTIRDVYEIVGETKSELTLQLRDIATQVGALTQAQIANQTALEHRLTIVEQDMRTLYIGRDENRSRIDKHDVLISQVQSELHRSDVRDAAAREHKDTLLNGRQRLVATGLSVAMLAAWVASILVNIYH
jgi:hypothetical protein